MLLIDVKLIRDRLVLEDTDSVNDALKSAVLGASPRLEAVLQTSFAKGSSEDLFSIRQEETPTQGMYALRLKHGFVRATPAMTVKYSETFDGDYVDIAFTKNMERGLVYVPDTTEKGFVKVAYEYGFGAASEVPQWLREVAVAYAIKVLSMSAVNDKKDELSSVYEFVDSHSDTILRNHLRIAPNALIAI